ncbi:hypothetical protein TNCV_1921021 [Trichonephila clavipes]|nr:hypothetical protein TNCV_1921021 [Trichonephila clavipes]
MGEQVISGGSFSSQQSSTVRRKFFVTYMSNTSKPTVTGQQVVESWYSEHVFYPVDGHITREIIAKTVLVIVAQSPLEFKATAREEPCITYLLAPGMMIYGVHWSRK